MKEQICWHCDRACNKHQDDGIQCSWADRLKPVDGWKAMQVTKSHHDKTFGIIYCPLFKQDENEYNFSFIKQVIKIMSEYHAKTIYQKLSKTKCSVEVILINRQGKTVSQVWEFTKDQVIQDEHFKFLICRKIKQIYGIAGRNNSAQKVCDSVMEL